MLTDSFDGSIALMRQVEPGRTRWLAVWNQSAAEYRFIVSARLENESYRTCLSREIAWALDLSRDRDYLISSMARLHFEADKKTIEFYVVDFFGKRGLEKTVANPNVVWLSRYELLNRKTVDGKPINKDLCELLFASDVIPHDQPF